MVSSLMTMTRTSKVVIALTAVVALAAADPSFAGQRGRRGPGGGDGASRGDGGRRGDGGGRAVPRGSVRGAYPGGRSGYVAPHRHYNRGRYYGPSVRAYYGYPYSFNYYGYPRFYGYPGYYGYSPYANGWYGYGYPAYGYGPYAYQGSVGVAPGRPYGGVRIDLPERDAEVLVDGYYAGIVDDFDGTFQELKLEPGPHRIEIRAEGFEPVAFDVDVEFGRTITYRTRLRPQEP